MGWFDNETESRSFLDLPAWMQTGPQAIQGQLEGLIGQEFLSPEQQVAGLTAPQIQGIGGLTNFGADMGNQIASALFGAGMGGMGAIGQGQQALTNLMGQGPVQNMGPDMARAAQFAQDPFLDAQISAALRDPMRALTEQQLPGASLAAAASGNAGSTRRGVGEAILQRGFQDRAADVGAAMRGNAFQQGLGIEAQRAAQNAGMAQGFQGLQGNLAQALMGSGFQSAGFLPQAGQAQLQGIQAQLQGGQMLQNQEQALRDAGIRSFMFPYQSLQMLAPLQNQMAQTYGTQVSQQTQDPGIGNTLLGAGLALAGTAATGGLGGLGGLMGGLGGAAGGGAAGGGINLAAAGFPFTCGADHGWNPFDAAAPRPAAGRRRAEIGLR
jgi:hypothetical protein